MILAAAAYRVGAVFVPDLSNLSPIMALAFCGAVYFERRILWLVPFVALAASDVWIDRYYASHYGYTWELGGSLLRLACFAAAPADSSASSMPLGLNVGAGYFSCRPCIPSTSICEIATLRNHLWSAGMTNHGACLRLVRSRISS